MSSIYKLIHFEGPFPKHVVMTSTYLRYEFDTIFASFLMSQPFMTYMDSYELFSHSTSDGIVIMDQFDRVYFVESNSQIHGREEFMVT